MTVAETAYGTVRGTEIADGIVTAMGSPAALNEDFNISASREMTVAEIARVIWEACGEDPARFQLVAASLICMSNESANLLWAKTGSRCRESAWNTCAPAFCRAARSRRSPARTRASPMDKPNFRRVIVKLSGEALSGPEKFGIHQPTIERFAADLVAAHRLGIALGVAVHLGQEVIEYGYLVVPR